MFGPGLCLPGWEGNRVLFRAGERLLMFRAEVDVRCLLYIALLYYILYIYYFILLYYTPLLIYLIFFSSLPFLSSSLTIIFLSHSFPILSSSFNLYVSVLGFTYLYTLLIYSSKNNLTPHVLSEWMSRVVDGY